MENRLYYGNSYKQEFKAKVEDVLQLADDTWAAVLDTTLFCPESEGQPADHGWLGDAVVTDVREDGGRILHLMPIPLKSGSNVVGRIDWQRRFDHMQQHTGQHILSGLLFRKFGITTTRFHLSDVHMYIDLDTENISTNECRQIEKLANQAITANKPVECHTVTREKLRGKKLRIRPAKDDDKPRIMKIEGVDACACRELHVAYTGEIGLIKLVSIERRNGTSRLEFLCGSRALADYRQHYATLQDLAEFLSVPTGGVVQAVHQLQAKVDDLKEGLLERERARNDYLAKILFNNAQAVDEYRVVRTVLENYSTIDLMNLGKQCLFEQRHTIVLLASINKELGKVHFYFACSLDVSVRMNQLLKRILPLVNGRGGGNSYVAQGGGTNMKNAEKALDQATMMLKYIDSGN